MTFILYTRYLRACLYHSKSLYMSTTVLSVNSHSACKELNVTMGDLNERLR